jgi:hypothetical protein
MTHTVCRPVRELREVGVSGLFDEREVAANAV